MVKGSDGRRLTAGLIRLYAALSIICLLFAISCIGKAPAERVAEKKEARYAVAVLPTPVLDTPDFSSVFGGKDGKTLKLDGKNLVEEVEFIALPGTVFTIEETISREGHEMLRVKTADYPYETKRSYYIDGRFVEKKIEEPPARTKKLPGKETIINRMLAEKGAIYVWGGNYAKGIPQMLEYYSPGVELGHDIRDRWMLKGVDCSGLLYEAADGYTPRNVSSFFNYGRPVAIEGLDPDEIAKKLMPLDVIVYRRHMLVVINKTQVIESSISGGVRVRGLNEALRTVATELSPADLHDGSDKFVVRRWYSNS